MAGKQLTTNDNLRDLIDARFDSFRTEMNGNIKDVKNEVAELRKDVTNNEIKQAISSTKIGMLIIGISLVTSGIMTALIDMLKGRT